MNTLIQYHRERRMVRPLEGKTMLYNSSILRFLITFCFSLLLLFVGACAEVRLNTIPAPPPTAKLRVFLMPVSDPPPRRDWPTPHEEWALRQIMSVRRFLQKTGIYELATQEEIARVVGKKTFSHWDWSRKDWSLLRQVGQALHADYAMIMERAIVGGIPPSKNFETVLINVETGKRFKVVSRLKIDSSAQADLRRMQVVAYYEIFQQARNDILSTAIRKGRLAAPEFFARQPSIPPKSTPQSPAVPETTETIPAKSAVPSVPRLEENSSIPQEITKEVDYDKVLSLEAATRGRATLAVYDLDTIEPYRVIALILTEALRQELFKLGIFDLVNRENIVKVLEEMALQQTGLVDEKEAVKAGKGMAARQIVMGQYGALTKTSILQAKRVEVQTQKALGFGILKCDIGREEELLQKMPELAKEIAGEK